MHLPLALLILAVSLPAHAAVYKCAADKGGVVYQDTACAPGRELRNLDVDPARARAVPDAKLPAAAASPAPQSSQMQTGTVTTRGGNALQRKFLEAGMTEAEVLQKVGRPDVEVKARAKEGRRWSYLPTAGDPEMLTTLTFAGDKVAHVERKVMR